MSCGIYCGTKPNDLVLTENEWVEYKKNVISAFKQGDMHLLVGNKSVGVGLDNENLNWVVNYEMPSSLEDYYQACGRAGRNAQISPCALIFSDDGPIQTEQWLNDQTPITAVARPIRWDDIGIAAGFHEDNFPGKEQEIEGARNLLDIILQQQQNGISVFNNQEENTEKYILYWIILGVFTDYTKAVMGNNTVYTVAISNDVINRNENLNQQILGSLCRYLLRYIPVSENDIRQLVLRENGARFREKVIRYLISFIYDNIARQRKIAIRTMWEYCNAANQDSESLRKIILSYFDRSKFSDRLDAMTSAIPNFELVNDIIKEIEGLEGIERLYWETSCLLAENLYQAGLGAINLFAIFYREREFSENALAKFRVIVDSLHNDPQTSGGPARIFINSLLSSIIHIDNIEGAASNRIIVKFVEDLYDKYALTYILNSGDLGAGDDTEEILKLCITNKQLLKLIKIAQLQG